MSEYRYVSKQLLREIELARKDKIFEKLSQAVTSLLDIVENKSEMVELLKNTKK